MAAFEPPKLDIRGFSDSVVPSLAAIMERPAEHWPCEILSRRVTLRETPRRQVVFVTEPGLARWILTDRAGTFVRSRMQNRFFDFSFGKSLLDNRGGIWMEHRRNIARPIASHRLAGLYPAVASACRDRIASWEEYEGDAGLPLLREVRILAFDALWRALFAVEAKRTVSDPEIVAAGERLFAAHHTGFEHYINELRELARWVMHRARNGLPGLPAGDTGQPLDVNSALIFLDAGHDNVTATIGWALWLLAHRPDLQERVRAEWNGAEAVRADPDKLPVTMACVRETLRLYPPALQILRDVAEPVELDGIRVDRNAMIVIPVYALHRSGLWWREPDAYRPERFLGQEGDDPQAAAWIPFSKGERACFGAAFAQLELATFLGMIADRYELAPNPADPMRCTARWVLRPEADAPILLRPRDPARAVRT